MTQRSKRYQSDAKKASQDPVSVTDGVKKIRTFATTKFDQSVDMRDAPGHRPQAGRPEIRGAISLPHGIGKARKVIAFCEDSDAEAAKAAGAIEAGCDELIKKILDGWMRFRCRDRLAESDGQGRQARPRAGPAGQNALAQERHGDAGYPQGGQRIRAGKVEYRNDAGGNVHAVVGKLSFRRRKLLDNVQAFIAHIQAG